jgi:hypothetical protein
VHYSQILLTPLTLAFGAVVISIFCTFWLGGRLFEARDKFELYVRWFLYQRKCLVLVMVNVYNRMVRHTNMKSGRISNANTIVNQSNALIT